LLLHQDGGWQPHGLLWRATAKVLAGTLRRNFGAEATLAGRSVLLVGSGPVAAALLHGMQDAQTSLAVAGEPTPEEIHFCDKCGHEIAPEPSAAETLARHHGVRHVPLDSVADTRPEILVVADAALELGHGRGQLNPAWLRPPLVVVDVARLPDETDVLAEARQRGCVVVRPTYVFAELLSAQFRLLTGQPLPPAVFHEAVDVG
jgi:shikimate 5-dehydrogenase